MVQGQTPLDVSVLCEGIYGRVWPVVAQQRRHLTLQKVNHIEHKPDVSLQSATVLPIHIAPRWELAPSGGMKRTQGQFA